MTEEYIALVKDIHRAIVAFEREVGRLPEQHEVDAMSATIMRMTGWREHEIPAEHRRH